MGWQLAKPIQDLFAQWNFAAPNRSKVSDGTKGNAEHAARVSDHNPDSRGWVRAGDVTYDPAHGADVHTWIRRLVASGPPDVLKYAISSNHGDPRQAQIWTPQAGWQRYTGVNPHNHHCHISVVSGSENRSVNWKVGAQPIAVPTQIPLPIPNQIQETDEDEMGIYVFNTTTGIVYHIYGERFRHLRQEVWAQRAFLGAKIKYNWDDTTFKAMTNGLLEDPV